VSEFVGCSPSLDAARHTSTRSARTPRPRPCSPRSRRRSGSGTARTTTTLHDVVTWVGGRARLTNYSQPPHREVGPIHHELCLPRVQDGPDALDESKTQPNAQVIDLLNELCSDPMNVIFLVSGGGEDQLAEWFSPCEKLDVRGAAAVVVLGMSEAGDSSSGGESCSSTVRREEICFQKDGSFFWWTS
jgi:hypothetical protein